MGGLSRSFLQSPSWCEMMSLVTGDKQTGRVLVLPQENSPPFPGVVSAVSTFGPFPVEELFILRSKYGR